MPEAAVRGRQEAAHRRSRMLEAAARRWQGAAHRRPRMLEAAAQRWQGAAHRRSRMLEAAARRRQGAAHRRSRMLEAAARRWQGAAHRRSRMLEAAARRWQGAAHRRSRMMEAGAQCDRRPLISHCEQLRDPLLLRHDPSPSLDGRPGLADDADEFFFAEVATPATALVKHSHVLEPLLGKHTPSFQRTLVTQGIEGGCHRGAGPNAAWRKTDSGKQLTQKHSPTTATRTPFTNQFVADSVGDVKRATVLSPLSTARRQTFLIRA